MKYYYNLKDFFEEIVKAFLGNIAIKYEDKEYTYQEVNEWANSYASYLKKQKVTRGDVVAIASTKAFEDYALMIACLKSGIIYTNIDIDNPSERTNHIFNTCKPKIVFSKESVESVIECCKSLNIPYVNYNGIQSVSYANENPYSDFDGDTIAYIMFTSGSTGVPKGVAITHQNLIHFINWTSTRYNITPDDNLANINPMYFDNSVFDFYTALFNGAILAPVKKILLNDPFNLVQYIDKLKCTIWFSVPSTLIYLMTIKILTKDNFSSLRIITFGGEGYPKTELKKIFDLYKDRIKFINVYGPTECTCICSSYTITETDFNDLDELPSLGIINQNFSYVILDEQGKKSCEGELCLLGPNVGIGYFNNKERTSKIFTTYTDDGHYMKRMYRTGDLIKEIDGLLYFKGRRDNQIKHLGYRIELEEIEIAINSLKQISQAAAIYHRTNAAFGKIVAFIVPVNKDIDLSEIKVNLSKKIPSYMMPSVFKLLDSFPKNANGKINKGQLIKML